MDGALGARQAADVKLADRTKAGIDHEEIVEFVGQIIGRFAHMVDRVANGPEIRCRDEFALHQAAGGLIVKGEAVRNMSLIHISEPTRPY